MLPGDADDSDGIICFFFLKSYYTKLIVEINHKTVTIAQSKKGERNSYIIVTIKNVYSKLSASATVREGISFQPCHRNLHVKATFFFLNVKSVHIIKNWF